MRFFCSLALALACTAAALPNAIAATTAYGVGGKGCGDYIAARRAKDAVYEQGLRFWWSGYVTAFNVWNGTSEDIVARELDMNAMLAYLDKWCAQNPLSMSGEGLGDLARELARKR